MILMPHRVVREYGSGLFKHGEADSPTTPESCRADCFKKAIGRYTASQKQARVDRWLMLDASKMIVQLSTCKQCVHLIVARVFSIT